MSDKRSDHVEASWCTKTEAKNKDEPGKTWARLCEPGLNHPNDFDHVKRLNGPSQPKCVTCLERLPWALAGLLPYFEKGTV